MIVRGIRILDSKNNIVSVKLIDILNQIKDGADYIWAILLSEVIPNEGEGEFIFNIEEKIKESNYCFTIYWNDLVNFSEKIFQEIDLTVIGCKKIEDIHRYKSDVEMYETCDFVIEMIDSSYWEVFSKNAQFINLLSKNFEKTLPLETNFEK